MKELKHAIKTLIENKEYYDLVENFAISKYKEKFKNITIDVVNGAFHYYSDYEIISENEIKIKYCYGYYDEEYNDSFNVKLK